ncbi:MAG: hypothetical protein A2Z18_08050 [Armatimonadetes bacterium RBG_16_58_9]|nr:MAG: hypothetical protein A2Z18_08050 [Armatimonadetes bacterium RBG_16_58_9]
MRILYISQYFPPEVNAPAQRVFDFAKAWTDAGHEVVVLTGFPNHPAGKIFDGYKLRLLQRENIDGVDVVRAYLYPAPNEGKLRRCANYVSFMVSAATLGCAAVGKVDVVIASSPQLLVGVAGYWISRVKRVPFVLSVRDVWPEALVAVDAKVSRRLYNLLDRVANFLYKRADKIITVTRGAQDVIRRHGVDQAKLELIPTGVHSDVIKPMDPPQDIRVRYGDGESVIVSYVGTHGMAQKLFAVLRAAQLLADEPRVQFVSVGDGADKENLVRMKNDLALENVHFVDQLPRQEALDYIAASDICLVPLRKAELFKETIPSKLYEIMACGRPIILGVDGEARKLLETASAGIYVEPEEPQALADAIRKLATDPGARARYGENGRRFVTENFDKGILAEQFLSLLCSLADAPKSPGSLA